MKRIGTFLAITFGALALLMLIAVTAQSRTIDRLRPVVGVDRAVDVDVWTDRAEGAVYRPGESVNIYFHANRDCYVSIYDIDTEGNVRLLFPEYPDNGFVYGGTTYRLPDYYSTSALYVTGPRGIEYISAVATVTPNVFRFHRRRGGYSLNYHTITGDPFLAMNDINGHIVRGGHINATATTWFFVGGEVWYPRYMCGSCHTGAVRFDPYRDECPQYSVRISGSYDYWWNYHYYPARVSFRFGGPFWSVEVRTVPVHRHRRIRYIDVAYGHTNYYCPTPPRTAYRRLPIRTTHTEVRRERVQHYTPVTYKEVRSRETSVSRSASTGERTTTSRSRSTYGTEGTTTTTRSRTTYGTDGNATTTSRSRSGTSYDGGNATVTTRTRTETTTSSRSVPAPPASAPQGSYETTRERTRESSRSSSRELNSNTSTTGWQPYRPEPEASEPRSYEPRSYDPGSGSETTRERTRTTTRSTTTRSTTQPAQSTEIQTSRIPSASSGEAIPSRTTARPTGSESRSRQQSSSSSSSTQTRTRTR